MTIDLDRNWREEEWRRDVASETGLRLDDDEDDGEGKMKPEVSGRIIRSKERFFDLQMEHAEAEHELNERFANLHG